MNEIKQIATELNCSYIHDDFARINLLADKVTHYPLIAETLPTDGEIICTHAPAMTATKNVIVCFLTPCNFDFTGHEASDKINDMLELAQRFIVKYCALHGVDIPARLRYNAVLDFMDYNLCGVRVSLTTTTPLNCK